MSNYLLPSLSLALLGTAAVATAVRWIDGLRGGRGCFFTFHRAATHAQWADLPNRDFYLDLDFLDSLLVHLKKSGRKFVTIEEGLKRAADKTDRDLFVNFSIDDCYRDTYEKVAPLFRRHGIPLTLFVTTGIPDGTMSMCWAGLEETIAQRTEISVDGRKIETDTIARKRSVYLELQTAWDGPVDVRDEHYRRFCIENNVDIEAIHTKHAITWEMLAELARDPLVEIGSHTVSHPRISSLPPEEARREFSESRKRLQDMLGVEAKHFAFPYGRSGDCGPRDFDIAKDVGYESVATTTKGLLHTGHVPYAYPRITLNGKHRTLLVPELHILGASAVASGILRRG